MLLDKATPNLSEQIKLKILIRLTLQVLDIEIFSEFGWHKIWNLGLKVNLIHWLWNFRLSVMVMDIEF